MVPRDVAALVTGASRGIGEAVARQLARVHAAFDIQVGNVCAKEDLPKWGCQVIDTLHIAACWMTNCPDIQDPFQRPLSSFEAIKRNVRICPGHVDTDLVPNCFI